MTSKGMNIIGRRKIWFSFSGAMMLASIVFLLIWGFKLGIDFAGGSLLEVSFSQERPAVTEIEETLSGLNLESLQIQPSDDDKYLLRFQEVSEDEHQEILTNLQGLTSEENVLTENRFESIGPVIGNELKTKAIEAIMVVLIFIVLYIAYAFRKVSKPVASWKYGLAAIGALVHDILIITGVFVLLGQIANVEIDTLFVTALLTILGFSVHDTIVTFDRTRENLLKHPDKNFDEVVNLSINQTIIRSINTSVTTLFVLLAIYIFGGDTIKNFVLALILGVIIGTYSSIFVGSPLLVVFNRQK